MNLRNILIGAASAAAIVGFAGAAAAQSSATATVSATIVAPSSVSANRNLAFGTIAKPSTGTSTVTVPSAVSGGATPSISGGNAYVTSTGQASSAQFHITSAQTSFYIDPPVLTFTGVTSGVGNALGAYAATTPIAASTGLAVGTTAGTATTLVGGVDDIYVGGSIVLTSSTPVNTYNGTLQLTVNFQ